MSAPERGPATVTASPALPSGTVTFVFTDIEGSTRRWDRDRVAMQAAVRRHDELVRAAIGAHGGFVFKTVGDAFCAAFARPEAAVAAAYDTGRSLAAEDFSAVEGLKVRLAIHTGTADERDGDYYGPSVNRVARLVGIAHGGQVLVSGVSADLVQGALPAQASLRDLGEHRLRDLARPEHVYQLLGPGLDAEFAPLRSLDVLPNNLPLQLKSFVGREREIGEITALVEKHRLVTLVGSGGVGKTQTSLQVAANLLDGSGDGVWLIELAPLTAGEYIPTTVAAALGLTLPADGDRVASLTNALKGKRALLVFDNCEHLVDAAGKVIAALLRSCPHLKMLASSRQALGIDGEETYRMPSLDVPGDAAGGHLRAADALQWPAIALFTERALTVDKRFSLTDENAPAVADICRRLDGIPLAIELAAARVRLLSPRQLRERLDERFRVLTGGSHDVLPRQQTLRAMIDWSFDLLDARERTLFRRLGIFVDGFTLEGAATVGSDEGADALDVFDVLASLVDKSLVLAEQDRELLRYRLLESTRVYAFEKLDEAGERTLLAGRHLKFFRDRFAVLAERLERTARVAEREDELARELADVRSALDAAFARSDIVSGGWLLAGIGTAWYSLGLDSECIARCKSFLAALPAGEDSLGALLSITLSYFLFIAGQKLRAFETGTAAVEYARRAGDSRIIGHALAELVSSASFAGKFEVAAAAALEAEALPDPSPQFRIRLLLARASMSFFLGDRETTARTFERLRDEHRGLGNVSEELGTAATLAEAEFALGNRHGAIAIARDAQSALRSGSNTSLRALLAHNLAAYLTSIDDLSGAADSARDAIALFARLQPGNVRVAISIEHLALVFALRGDCARAATLEGYAEAAFARLGFEREFTEESAHDRLVAVLRERLSPAEIERLTAAGATLAPEAAISLATEAAR